MWFVPLLHDAPFIRVVMKIQGLIDFFFPFMLDNHQ